ncbi:MAG TPA: OpcA/G6PD domain-containing protein [Candidatus Polarisedimenticolia bacterium]|nr:OpcA/G6PD domain-containing protein [Candidatus Polarisedimenticolia bacterium]
MTDVERLLPEGVELSFAEINASLGRCPGEEGNRPQGRALAATVVTVGSDARLNEAARALDRLRTHTAVRTILISVGSETRPVPRRAGDTIALSGLQPSFVNNAVAALRLSSLPTIVWWRGGRQPGVLEGLTHLADRVVLDDEEPMSAWRRAAALFDRAAFSDLTWTRLTRWRTLMANFFDIPEVRAASPRFDRLRITGADAIAAKLFAAWITDSLDRSPAIETEIIAGRRGAFIEEVRFGDGEERLLLRLAPSGSCVQTSAEVRDHRSARRTVSLGDQSLTALMTEELAIRARDRAFEAAVRACVGAAGRESPAPEPGRGATGPGSRA